MLHTYIYIYSRARVSVGRGDYRIGARRIRCWPCLYIVVLSSDNSSATSSVEALAPYGRTLHNRERWTQSTVTRHARIFDVRHAVASRRVHSAGYYIHTPELPKSKPLCCTFVRAPLLSSPSYARIVANTVKWRKSERFRVSFVMFLETDYENYGICLINGVIEIAELWNYFTNVVPNVIGRKYPYIHGCGCVYEFRWNSNYERGMENM